MIRRIFSLLAVLVLLGLVPLSASARAVPDLSRTDCTIEVVVRYDGTKVSGGTLTAIRVGNVAEEDGNYFFTRVPDGAVLENIQSASAAAELKAYVKANENTGNFEKHTVSVRDGRAAFQNLSTGLYLIVQEIPAQGYSALNPFLVTMPYLENETYRYSITAAAKTALEQQAEPTTPLPTEPAGKLPQTGQLNWPIPLMVITGLLLLALGGVFRLAGKQKKPAQ